MARIDPCNPATAVTLSSICAWKKDANPFIDKLKLKGNFLWENGHIYSEMSRKR
jgi:hypothetical protein